MTEEQSASCLPDKNNNLLPVCILIGESRLIYLAHEVLIFAPTRILLILNDPSNNFIILLNSSCVLSQSQFIIEAGLLKNIIQKHSYRIQSTLCNVLGIHIQYI